MNRQEIIDQVVDYIENGEDIPLDQDSREYVEDNYDLDGIANEFENYIDTHPDEDIRSIDDIDPNFFNDTLQTYLRSEPLSASVNKKAEEDIVNSYGVHFSPDQWNDIAMLMDDDLREEIHSYADDNMTKQQFFDAYARAYEDKYGEEWELDTPHPQW